MSARSRLRTLSRILLLSLVGVLIAAAAGWGVLAIEYRAPVDAALRHLLGAALVLLAVGAVVGLFARRARRATAAFLVGFAAMLVWWSRIEPRNDRDWQPDVARLASAEVDGDRVTIRNIRNNDYRSETDFTPRYYDRTFDLRTLDTLDIIATYWMGDAIAHVMVSFGFSGKDYLTVSIETRKERGESYSTLAGFFREYELYYVVADERDLIRLRTNYRHDPPEDVYVYRTKAPPENVRRLFLSYLKAINALNERPEFYNTLTTNCTTTIWQLSKVNQQSLKPNWKILVSGYLPQLLYETGRLDTRLPFAELRERSHVNAAAQAANEAEDFSQRIRASVPMPPPP
ncbi:MAG: DUF4105 domain-containing protein [Candidatus Binatia bacterium]